MAGDRELVVAVDRASGVPLVRQLYETIRDGVLQGRLRPGDTLPASRQLARQLGVSRTVVLNAYDQLLAEGYLITKHGSGTFVSAGVAAVQAESPPTPVSPAAVVEVRAVFSRTLPPEDHAPDPPGLPPVTCDFRHGVPAWDAFPMSRWQQAVLSALGRAGSTMLGYGPAEGVTPLREAVARIIRLTRAVPADPARIVITTGATQALDMLARLVVEPSDVVVVEDPAHPVMRQIFRFCGATVVPVPVDDEGLRVDLIDGALAALAPGAAPRGRVRMVYVTPAHQFPTGGIMSLSRKLALLDWARRHGALVVEDDYDSEFWYGRSKVSALAGLGRCEDIVYVGSFSKTMFPALRLGYVLLPPHLLQPFVTLKWTTDRLSPTVEQEALAGFIDSGAYGRHLAAMTRLYGRRRAALVKELHQHLGGRVTVGGAAAGLHLLASLKTFSVEEDIAARCRSRGVRVYPASHYYAGRAPDEASFLLGYAALPEADIAAGVRVLASAAVG